MHLLVVRKSRKKDDYVLIGGNSHYEYLRKHTKKIAAPCLVDESNVSARIHSLVQRFRKRNLPYDIPLVKRERTPAASWSIIRRFLRQEPRFSQLTRKQQIKVLRLGLQYKKTTVASMKATVDDMTKKR